MTAIEYRPCPECGHRLTARDADWLAAHDATIREECAQVAESGEVAETLTVGSDYVDGRLDAARTIRALNLAAARQSVPVTAEKPPLAMFMWGVLRENGTPLERPEMELLERKLHARFTITRKPTETEEEG